MTHLHAKKPDNVRVIQPGERSHLLAGRVHHDRRRDLDGNACETAPGHRQLRQRQLARAVSACTQRKVPQTTKKVAELCEHSHSPVCTCCPRRTAPWAPEPKSLPHATEPSGSRTPASNHRGEAHAPHLSAVNPVQAVWREVLARAGSFVAAKRLHWPPKALALRSEVVFLAHPHAPSGHDGVQRHNYPALSAAREESSGGFLAGNAEHGNIGK